MNTSLSKSNTDVQRSAVRWSWGAKCAVRLCFWIVLGRMHHQGRVFLSSSAIETHVPTSRVPSMWSPVSACLSSAPCPQHALSSLTPRGPLAFKTALYAGRLGLQAVWVFFSLVDHRAVSRSTRPSSGTPCSSTSSQPSSFRCQPRPRCSRRLTRASTPPSPMTQYTTTPTCLPRGSPAPMGTTVLSAKVCPLL